MFQAWFKREHYVNTTSSSRWMRWNLILVTWTRSRERRSFNAQKLITCFLNVYLVTNYFCVSWILMKKQHSNVLFLIKYSVNVSFKHMIKMYFWCLMFLFPNVWKNILLTFDDVSCFESNVFPVIKSLQPKTTKPASYFILIARRHINLTFMRIPLGASARITTCSVHVKQESFLNRWKKKICLLIKSTSTWNYKKWAFGMSPALATWDARFISGAF